MEQQSGAEAMWEMFKTPAWQYFVEEAVKAQANWRVELSKLDLIKDQSTAIALQARIHAFDEFILNPSIIVAHYENEKQAEDEAKEAE